jgi:thiol-disulfide isomerase/thioredoxin
MTLLVSRFLLVGVFALAALAKLSDREGVRQMVMEFGIPRRFAAPFSWGLIGCEAGAAGALAFAPSARIGAAASVLLLAAFGSAVAVAVTRGRRLECHCFGRLQAAPVSWSIVARNALLATVAGFVVAGGRLPGVFASVAGVLVVVRLGLEIYHPGSLRPGAMAPAIDLGDLAGAKWSLESPVAAGRPLLLVFGDPDCGACLELMPRIAGWQQRLASECAVALVSGGSAADNAALADQFGLRTVLTDQERVTATAYGVTATPTAVLVDDRRRIAASPALGEREISELVARTTASEPVFQRRTLLAQAAAGVGAVSLTPFLGSAAAAARALTHVVRPKKLKIDGAWLCDQRYALCTFAACKPSPTNKNISVCRCRVKTGYSVGFKNCDKRAAKGRQLHSNFALQDVTKQTRSLKCSARGLWVQCLDVVCQVDPKDSKHALCQCVNQHTKNFYTFGGNCDTKTCQTVIWSATTAPFPGGAQLEKGLKRLGLPFTVPKPCPTKR